MDSELYQEFLKRFFNFVWFPCRDFEVSLPVSCINFLSFGFHPLPSFSCEFCSGLRPFLAEMCSKPRSVALSAPVNRSSRGSFHFICLRCQ